MVTFRDMAFCSDICFNMDCKRNLAVQSLRGDIPEGARLTITSFKNNCKDYKNGNDNSKA